MASKAWIYAGLGIAAAGVGAVGLVRALSGPRVRPGDRMFLVGDSFAVGLAPHLAVLAREGRAEFEHVAKEGTRIDQWANSQVMKDKLKQFRPTLVVVSLGTNDEYLGEGGAARQAPYLDVLLRNLQGLAPEVAWIGPPKLPKPKSNGVLALLRSKIPESHYFPSQNLQVPRGPDALHPTARGYAGWAGAIWRWLS